MTVIVAAQASPKSKTQMSEIYDELKKHHPGITFKPLFIEVPVANESKNTSKDGSDRSNFPSHEVDAALFERRCNAVIHSIEDLSEPLEKGLAIAAITTQKLAVVTRRDAHAMLKLFSCIDRRSGM